MIRPPPRSTLFPSPTLSRSAYSTRRLSYFLNQSVPLIGADRVSNELGITGKGVTVAVIDTGIDATHPDLPFGSKVIQNVKITPDLFGIGSVVLEGIANTDTTSGHGTQDRKSTRLNSSHLVISHAVFCLKK